MSVPGEPKEKNRFGSNPFDALYACSGQAPFDANRAQICNPGASDMRSRLALELRKDHAPLKPNDLTFLPTLEPPGPVDGYAFVYILACSEGTLYIGSTTDLRVRLAQHGGPKGAKFMRDHAGGRLVYYEGPSELAITFQRERQLKRWSRAKKLALIQNQAMVLRHLSQSREKRR
jgi:putative endonuclease